MKDKNSKFSQFALSVITSILVLVLAEFLFRIFSVSTIDLSAEKMYESQKSNMFIRVNEENIEIGDEQFREEKLTDELFGEKYMRILFLGDSFTWGSGIKDRNDRFSNIIETRLNKELQKISGSKKIHIFNAGVGGANPVWWVKHLNVIEPFYKPHSVFAIFFLRDGTRLGSSLFHHKGIIDQINKKYERLPFYNSSHLLRFMCNRLAWKEFTDTFKGMLTSSYLGSYEQQTEWRHQQVHLLQIAEMCKQKRIPFHLVIFPLLFNLKSYEFHEVEEEIKRFAKAHDIASYSLTPGFLGEDDHTLWVAPSDQHPNEKANRIAADTLQPFIRTTLTDLFVDNDNDGMCDPGKSAPRCTGSDNCPTVYNPDQKDSNGNGVGDACEHTYLWLETEDAETIVDPLKVSNSESASKGRYIYSQNDTGNQSAAHSVMARYRVSISLPGIYFLWGRVKSSDEKNNSFFVKMDNGLDHLWDVEPGDYWHWDKINDRRFSDPVMFNLSSGTHTINIKLGEDGTELDKLLLTNTIVGTVPSGEGMP